MSFRSLEDLQKLEFFRGNGSSEDRRLQK
ncbi:hypothetical protein A2U01_0112727, partial [Trifolium medium]|nr:hypothetical protein [Trifolium medium]